jgi:hypothetical protein
MTPASRTRICPSQYLDFPTQVGSSTILIFLFIFKFIVEVII